MRRRHHAAIALFAALMGACIDDPPVRELRDWEVEVDGVRDRLQLPAHVGRGLAARAGRYVLRTEVPLDPSWRGRTLTLGLPLLRRRRSNLIGGLGTDAVDLADHLRGHLDGRAAARVHVAVS